MASSSSSYAAGEIRPLLDRSLRRFRTIVSLLNLGRRLFQKDVDLIREMDEKLAAVDGDLRASEAHRFILDKMVKAVTDGLTTGSKMPAKAESYIAFLDLCFVVGANANDSKKWGGDDEEVEERELENAVEGEGGDQEDLEWGGGGGGGGETVDLGLRSGRKWHAFGIKGFDPEVVSSIPIPRLRRRLKQHLPEDQLASVQMELDYGRLNRSSDGEAAAAVNESSILKRIFFRVAMVKRSKSGRGDEAKLITKAPCFLAYYPGEQYFYCDRSDPAPIIPDAVVKALSATSHVSIPLSGPNLESLRQMRLSRDGKRDPISVGGSGEGGEGSHPKRPRKDPTWNINRLSEGDPHQAAADDHSGTRQLPVITNLTVSCTRGKIDEATKRVANFADVDEPHRRLPFLLDSLDVEVQFKGPDVLGGFAEIASSDSSSSIFTASTVPKWLSQATNRGRNVIVLRDSTRNNRRVDENGEGVGVAAPPDDDQDAAADDCVSIIGSEMTVLIDRPPLPQH